MPRGQVLSLMPLGFPQFTKTTYLKFRLMHFTDLTLFELSNRIAQVHFLGYLQRLLNQKTWAQAIFGGVGAIQQKAT